MTEDDKKVLEEQIKENKISPEMKSRLDSLIFRLLPKRLRRKNGCFGSPGLNRKEKRKKLIQQKIQEIVDQQKEEESKE